MTELHSLLDVQRDPIEATDSHIMMSAVIGCMHGILTVILGIVTVINIPAGYSHLWASLVIMCFFMGIITMINCVVCGTSTRVGKLMRGHMMVIGMRTCVLIIIIVLTSVSVTDDIARTIYGIYAFGSIIISILEMLLCVNLYGLL